MEMAAAYEREQRLLAQAQAASFEERLHRYEEARKDNPDILAAIWWDRMSDIFRRMKERGAIDLLDHHLGPDGLHLTQFPPMPGKLK
jgi:hypothetical protein